MQAQVPLHNHVNSNRDENAHASSFKKVTMLRVIESRLKESNSGRTVIHHDKKKCCGIGALNTGQEQKCALLHHETPADG